MKNRVFLFIFILEFMMKAVSTQWRKSVYKRKKFCGLLDFDIPFQSCLAKSCVWYPWKSKLFFIFWNTKSSLRKESVTELKHEPVCQNSISPDITNKRILNVIFKYLATFGFSVNWKCNIRNGGMFNICYDETINIVGQKAKSTVSQNNWPGWLWNKLVEDGKPRWDMTVNI